VKNKNKANGLVIVEVMVALVITTMLMLVLGRSIRANLSFLSRLNKKKSAKHIWFFHEHLRKDLENCVQIKIDREDERFFLLWVPMYRVILPKEKVDAWETGKNESFHQMPTELFAFQKVFYGIMENRIVRVSYQVKLQNSESRELFDKDALGRDQESVWELEHLEMKVRFHTAPFESNAVNEALGRKHNKPSHLSVGVSYKEKQADPITLLIHCRNIKSMPAKVILDKPNAVYQ